MTDGKRQKRGGVWVQLVLRVPKPLHRAVKLRCVETEALLTDFVVAAVRDKLARSA